MEGAERTGTRSTCRCRIRYGSSCCGFVMVGAAILCALLLPAAAAATAAEADASFDYKDALSKSVLYFEAQRSGRLPYNQRITWRGNSGLTDGLQQGVDLVGGYYDAGDHVKFGLPMAFTVTMLSWSVIEYGDEIAAAGEHRRALEAIKWGADYFIKAHTHPHVLWVEVGDGDTDHYCWQRPEDMTTSRQAYKIDAENPGSDVAGETAAAMAAASIVFRNSSRHYSRLLLHHARQLFEFADKHRGKYDGSVLEAKRYYPSWSGYEDELLWAALWLHRATGEAEYLDYAVRNAYGFGGTGWAMTEFSWDVKFAGVQVLASKILMEDDNLLISEGQREVLEQYRKKAEHYLCACLRLNANATANVHRTPGGMLYVRQWNNMQYVAGAAFLLAAYADGLRGEQAIRCPAGAAAAGDLLGLAKSQADYILGANPMGTSYLVGFGPRYPLNVHHRGSSIVSFKRSNGFIGCMQGYYDWYGRRGPNPNVVAGALVGGPDSRDRFRDQRGNYMQTEACTYNTAPLVGVFARLRRQPSIREVSTPAAALSG